MFTNLLEWKLLRGSHEFPGPEGGTCLTEAAIVASGHRYRAVQSHKSVPPSFSPALVEFTISINDSLGCDRRQDLLRYIMRFDGSVDTAEIEDQRAEFMLFEVARTCLSPVIDRYNYPMVSAAFLISHGFAVGNVTKLTEKKLVDGKVAKPADPCAIMQCVHARKTAMAKAADKAKFAGRLVEGLLNFEYGDDDFKRVIETRIIGILGKAFDIGNQAKPVDAEMVVERMAKAKADSPLDDMTGLGKLLKKPADMSQADWYKWAMSVVDERLYGPPKPKAKDKLDA